MGTVLTRIAVVAGVALAVGAGALAVSWLTEDDPPRIVITLPATSAPAAPAAPVAAGDGRPLSAAESRRAGDAALRVTGGGTVAEVERSDDPGEAYEVEVITDGEEHDIALDGDFRPVPNLRYDD